MIRCCARSASQLKGCLSPYDRLARVGGDEFTVILDSLGSPAEAASVAQKLVEQVADLAGEGDLSGLGVSIGIACLPTDGGTVEGLLRAADTAMYEARRDGRRQYRFYQAAR